MKKRLFLVLGLCAVAAIGLAACNNTQSADAKTCDTLNALAAKSYASVTLTVDTTLEGVTLTGTYKSTATSDGSVRVEYTYERMNEIVKNEDGTYTFPDEMKSTVSGTGTITNGVFTPEGGEDVEIPTQAITAAGLKFAPSYFKNVTDEAGSFKADVSDAAGFLGHTVTFTAMKVEVKYTESSFIELTVSYTPQKGESVTLHYYDFA